MSILIRGMEMPTKVLTVEIHPDGYVCLRNANKVGEAVPVPEHGRLIDADALRQDWLGNGENEYVYDTNAFLDSLDNEPTIIPADPADKEGEG